MAEMSKDVPRILIVDDVEANRFILSDIMVDMGYQPVLVENGEQALRMMQHMKPQLIISDIAMPGMDGYELCRQIKLNPDTREIPIIFISAFDEPEDIVKGFSLGGEDYITKPFSITILRQRIHNIIERTKQHHHRFATEVNVEPSEITITSLDEIFITKAIAVVEKHMDEPDFSVEDFSVEMGIHRSQLYKKLLHLTGKKPLQFIRLLRLKRGKQLLEKSGMYVSEVAYKTGFNSPRFFSKYFKEEFGITPKEFQSSIGGNPEFSTESRTTVISEP